MNGDGRSHGLWESSAPPAPDTAALNEAITADVVVIGAGYTGCSAALHLAAGGVDVVVLEAAGIGFGGAGRNVGLVNAGLWVMPDAVPEALGADTGEQLLRQLGEAPSLVFDLIEKHDIACEPIRNGTLHCGIGAAGARELAERAAQWGRRGAPVKLFEGAEAARLTGTDAYPAVLLDRRAGTIQPLAYVRGLARAAIGSGARIHTRSPAVACDDLGHDWCVSTPDGSVTARRVIVATDVYSTGPWSQLKQEQAPLPYFNLATAPLPENLRARILPGGQGAWDTKSILSSFRLDAAGRLIFGSVGALRHGGEQVHVQWARRELAHLFPELGQVEFEHGWFGTIGLTDDALPRLHALGRNILSLSGFNGRGIAPGTSLGRSLAHVVLNNAGLETIPLPLSLVQRTSMRALKGAYYEAGAQIAHAVSSRL